MRARRNSKGKEREKNKAKKTLRPHYEILLALSSLWIKMNYCTATATTATTTTTTTMATTVRTTITTRVNNGNGNHNTSKR